MSKFNNNITKIYKLIKAGKQSLYLSCHFKLLLKNISFLFVGIMLNFITSCSSTKGLSSKEYLYKKSNLEIKDVKQKDNRLSAEELSEYLVPTPNKKFLGLFRFRLWMYNLAGDSVPDKGFRNWMKNKIGEPPVLYKSYYEETSKRELGNALKNYGYFENDIESEVIKHGKKAIINYVVKPGQVTCVDTLIYPEVTDTLTKYIADAQALSLIRKNDFYDLGMLKKERERLSNRLKNEGFFYASPDIFLFRADTIHVDKYRVKLTMSIKKSVPENSKKIYNIGDIHVFHDPENEQTGLTDSIFDGGIYHWFDENPSVKTKVLNRCVFFATGDVYNDLNYKTTLQKLTNLHVYRFLNVRFDQDSSLMEPVLDANIYLNSAMPKSLSLEMQGISKSNDFVGPGISLTYFERNLKSTATTFKFELSSSFESQFSKGSQGNNAYEFGADVEFTFPRLLIPFVDDYNKIPRKYEPKSRLSFGYNFSGRSKTYDMNSLDVNWGYIWHESKSKTHELRVPFITYLHIKPQADWSYIQNFVENDIDEELIIGTNYTFTYNDLYVKKSGVNTYFNGSIELAGNTLSLGEIIFNKDRPDKDAKILGMAYSQYARFYTDLRFYYAFSQKHKLVTRLAMGLAIPYGNSDNVPYNKQFYSGGVSSIRAFPYESIGPGSYVPADTISDNIAIDQAGDIKLEANIEYRFGIAGYLKGALFMDAGNVWLLNEDGRFPGGEFKNSDFYKQIAMGTGFGLRLDASFFVVRFDIAFPLRTPWKVDGKNWVGSDINLFKSSWRKDNLVYNLAFGYPF